MENPFFGKDRIEYGRLLYFVPMTVGITSYWCPYEFFPIAGCLLNYLIVSSKVLFGEILQTSVPQSVLFLFAHVAVLIWVKNRNKHSFFDYSWRCTFAVASTGYHFKQAFKAM
jgi:hypothetical protein